MRVLECFNDVGVVDAPRAELRSRMFELVGGVLVLDVKNKEMEKDTGMRNEMPLCFWGADMIVPSRDVRWSIHKAAKRGRNVDEIEGVS